MNIIRAIDLENEIKTISNNALGANFSDSTQKAIGEMQKEIDELLERKPEIVVNENELDWGLLQ